MGLCRRVSFMLNARDEMAIGRIDGVYLGVIPPGKPQHFSIGRDSD